jgi:excisionase family DNA binding protein
VAAIGIRETYIRVKKAAEVLGVSPNTVRAWGAAGKIPEFRHPVNGHRLYRRGDMEDLLQQIEQTAAPSPKRKKSSRETI